MNDFEEITSLIFDIGSFSYKIGLSGMSQPSCINYPFLGINRNNDILYNQDEISNYLEDNPNKNDLKIFPLMSTTHGGIDNFDLFEEYLDHFITNNSNLLNDMVKHPFLFSEPSIHNKEKRMKLTELMFEKFSIPSLFICKSSVLSSFAFGKCSCVIIDFGHSIMSVVPVHDGMTVKKSILINDYFNGININNEIIKYIKHKNNIDLLNYGETSYDKSVKFYLSNLILHNIKTFITDESSNNNEVEMTDPNASNNNDTFTLPDGRRIVLDKKEIKDKLFNSIFDESNGFKSENNLSNMIYNSISKIETEVKREMFGTMLLTGGNSLLFDTINKKVQEDITKRVSMATVVKMNSHMDKSDRTITSWLGASILTSLGTFVQWCVSKEDYEEHGPVVIERKCA